MNRLQLQIYCLVFFVVTVCAFGEEPPELVGPDGGYCLVDAHHSLFYKSKGNQWVYGIILPWTPVPGMSIGPTNDWAAYSNGVYIQVVNNVMTITNGTKKVTINIKPKTIYLLNPDFTYKESEDFSGIQFALKTGEDHETGHKVTFYELELPKKLCDRFEIQKR